MEHMISPNWSQRPPSPVKTDTLLLHYSQNNQLIPKSSAIRPNPTSFTNLPPPNLAPALPPDPPTVIPPWIKTAPRLPKKRLQPPHTAEPPAKKHFKWLPEEDTLIIKLRGNGLSWEEISKRLPGRSATSCRLHYQNYLERRVVWTEDGKNKLARLYTKYKEKMWSKVAEEMAIPWRTAEAMHWQLGEQEMALRAGVMPFIQYNAVDRSTMFASPALSSPRPQLPSLKEFEASISLNESPVSWNSCGCGLCSSTGKPQPGLNGP